MRSVFSVFLSLVLIFQTIGPGVFPVKEALADTTLFSDSFGIVDTNTVTGWAEDDTNGTFTRIDTEAPTRPGSPTIGYAHLGDFVQFLRLQ